MTDYYETNGVLDYIPIGFDATTYKLIIVENISGTVFLLDTEKNEKEAFYESIKTLINNISFKSID